MLLKYKLIMKTHSLYAYEVWIDNEDTFTICFWSISWKHRHIKCTIRLWSMSKPKISNSKNSYLFAGMGIPNDHAHDKWYQWDHNEYRSNNPGTNISPLDNSQACSHILHLDTSYTITLMGQMYNSKWHITEHIGSV